MSLKERNTLEMPDNPVPRTSICCVVNWLLALNLSSFFTYLCTMEIQDLSSLTLTLSLAFLRLRSQERCGLREDEVVEEWCGLKLCMLKDQAYVKSPTWKFHLDSVLEPRSWRDVQVWTDISRWIGLQIITCGKLGAHKLVFKTRRFNSPWSSKVSGYVPVQTWGFRCISLSGLKS